MAKHNYKKKFMASLINRKKQMKLKGDAKEIEDIELLEIPAISVYSQNTNGFPNSNHSLLNGSKVDDLVKEVTAVNFRKHKKHRLVDATADTIVDMPFTETYQYDFDKNRRDVRILELESEDPNQKRNHN